jgi:1-acyl-sn-glycerol-3-phosphate acyltransferase
MGNAARALDTGAAVLVYPGGDYETHRPSCESARVDFDHRHGFITLALERGLPIVPVVSIGGQETALFLARGERLAHALSLDRALHLHVLPISLALPWGVNVGDLLGHVPLPAKITVQVLPRSTCASSSGRARTPTTRRSWRHRNSVPTCCS